MNAAEYMIVYTGDPARVANFHAMREVLPDLRLARAIDTMMPESFARKATVALRKRIVTSDGLRRVSSQGRLGALGLFLSRWDILARTHRAGAPHPVLILEDDAIPLDDAPAKLQKLLDCLPAEWDYVLLEHRNTPPGDHYAARYRVSDCFFRLRPQYGTAATLLSPAGVAKFLQHLPAPPSSDSYLNRLLLDVGWHAYLPAPEYMPFRTGGTVLGKRTPDSRFGSLLWGVP